MGRDNNVQILWGNNYKKMSTEEIRTTNGWRELLAVILQNPQKKQELLEELSIRPITLTRWINGETEPRKKNLKQLAVILTRYHDELPNLAKSEKKQHKLELLPHQQQEELLPIIPSEFYAQVLETRAHTPSNQRFWVIANMILRQAMDRLDPQQEGISAWITRCSYLDEQAPEQHKIRSLRLTLGYHSWYPLDRIEQEGMLLGIEISRGRCRRHGSPNHLQSARSDRHAHPYFTRYRTSMCRYLPHYLPGFYLRHLHRRQH